MDSNKQNIKSVRNMQEYIEKVYYSFFSLFKIFRNFHDELCNLQNDINFRSMSQQLIESYNRHILFLYEQIKGVLSIMFINEHSQEIPVIKPVYNNKYSQELELTYFSDDIIATKPLGNVICISLNKINDEIILLRGNKRFTFIVLEDCTEITKNEFREHIETYIKMTKEIINWLNSDTQNLKMSIKSLINIISELTNMTTVDYIPEWIELLRNIKKTLEKINN
jgi:hypothetical protein